MGVGGFARLWSDVDLFSASLKAELPYLVKALGQDAGARYTLDWRIR